jgi:glutamate racemase
LAAAAHYLGPLFEDQNPPDTLVLGCTHFPVLAGAIRRTVGERIALVDSAETTAAAVDEALAARKLTASGESDAPALRYFATDSPKRFARVGAIFLGRAIDEADVELVDLRKA